ncbi:bifunctional metallophosphatase/5'-nucleotidase [Sphingobacterium lactis]|uniref:bifunctional metallophosphatase/5'-nucleotidase n=1 Tax=Sphingobacterium lactis TaxID=797291 RepID=UPI003DA36627
MNSIWRAILLLLALLSAHVALPQQPQLLYFTDAHQLYALDDVPGGRGGVARLKYVVDRYRQDNPQLLTIHGGDFVGGVLYGGLFKGKHMVQALNRIPVDIFNFGQHEFDYGVDHLQGLISASKGQFFSSNLIQPNGTPIFDLPKSLVKQIQGKQFLFIGLTDQMNTTKQDPRIQAEDIHVAVELVFRQQADKAFDQVIVLSQMDLQKNRELVRRFPQITLVLTEELHEYDTQIDYVGQVPIVATAGNMSSVAAITFSDAGRPSIAIIALDSTIRQDPQMLRWETEERAAVDGLLGEKLGHLQVALAVDQGRTGESLAGNLITDAMQSFYQTDIALIDGNGIRNAVDSGEFTLEKTRQLLPFGNKIVVVRMAGKDLKAFISSQLLAAKPKVMQVAGMRYKWDKRNNQVLFPTLSDEEQYTVAMNDYNFGKLDVPVDVLVGAESPSALEDFDVLKRYVQKRQVIRPVLSKRITIIEKD